MLYGGVRSELPLGKLGRQAVGMKYKSMWAEKITFESHHKVCAAC